MENENIDMNERVDIEMLHHFSIGDSTDSDRDSCQNYCNDRINNIMDSISPIEEDISEDIECECYD